MSSNVTEFDPASYQTLFENKCRFIRDTFSLFNLTDIDFYPSPAQNFRMRAEFKIWHDDDVVSYAMYYPGEYKKSYIIEAFPIGSQKISALMPLLLEQLKKNDILRNRLFQVEFLTTTTEQAITTLIYHRELDELWKNEAIKLEKTLKSKIIGRSKKQKVVISDDYVIERFAVGGETYHYQQVETGFTQPNALVCQSMLNWAQNKSRHIGGDLLELYCGNGNFTIPLAPNFNRILATEVSKTSVKSARYNISLNNKGNIEIVRMSSEEFCQALNKERSFHRLRDIPLDQYQFSTVFVDPPRAGLDKKTENMVSRFDNILYISCNPETLKNNLMNLTRSHDIRAFAFFDQFPYTDHCECGVLLSRHA